MKLLFIHALVSIAFCYNGIFDKSDSSQALNDEDHYFGLHKSYFDLTESARQHQDLIRLAAPKKSIPRKENFRLYFKDWNSLNCIGGDNMLKGEVFCDRHLDRKHDLPFMPTSVQILDINVYENGEQIGTLTDKSKNIIILEGDVRHKGPRNLTFVITHTGCIKTEPYCHSVTILDKYYDPKKTGDNLGIIDLGKEDYNEECIGFFRKAYRRVFGGCDLHYGFDECISDE